LGVPNVQKRRHVAWAAQKVVAFSLLAAVLVFILLIQDPSPHPARISAVTRPYAFDLVAWQARGLLGEVRPLLSIVIGNGVLDDANSPNELAKVERYFAAADEEAWLSSKVRWEAAQQDHQSLPQDAQQLSALVEERASLRTQVEAVLEKQISGVLAHAGLAAKPFFAPTKIVVFPPVSFRFEQLPRVLIVSPRDRIAVISSVMLRPDIAPAEIEDVERSLRSMGLAGLVVPIGGLATYPAMVPESYSLQDTIEAAAHEWVHAYFFFQPLGQAYWGSYEARSINETAADLLGKEIAAQVLKLYPSPTQQQAREPYPDPSKPKPDPSVDFNKEMRDTRLMVDELLKQDKVDEAEAFMDQKQQFLADHGYTIRKINQAYFAFYGSYAEGPGVVSPLPGKLKSLREKVGSLGEFMKLVSQVTSLNQLDKTLAERQR